MKLDYSVQGNTSLQRRRNGKFTVSVSRLVVDIAVDYMQTT